MGSALVRNVVVALASLELTVWATGEIHVDQSCTIWVHMYACVHNCKHGEYKKEKGQRGRESIKQGSQLHPMTQRRLL